MFSFFKRKKKDQQPAEQDVAVEETLETSTADAAESDSAAADTSSDVAPEAVEPAEASEPVEKAVEEVADVAAEESRPEPQSDDTEVSDATVRDVVAEAAEPASDVTDVEAAADVAAEADVDRANTQDSETVSEALATAVTADAFDAAAETTEETVEEVAAEPEVAPQPAKKGFFARIKDGLSRTRSSLTDGLATLLLGKKEIDEDLLEELETQLIMADVGVEATADIMGRLTERVSRKELKDSDALYNALIEELKQTLADVEAPLQLHKEKKPFVILMVGINGVGKTTTIGKLARQYQNEGKSVMLAAGDTFRAAAVEQLQVWGERNQVPVVAQHTGADSASVIFDAVQAAQSRNIDVLIADTAGRLHNKDNLMQELEKVVRVMKKLDPEAPHEVMLVLDAGTGQNAINQTKQFLQAVGVSGLTLTKLDGTAKGGVIFALAKQFGIPVRFIGVGEGIEDLRPFQASQFIDALFQRENQSGQ
ncbi:signal recognition particle-docking protein FtsY [Oceanobacter kriegii]|uniref:signal recognition particle-docking protein FtsY n=1 Tax=Oceanobacter kriegii TaxID=64972 RepID=UPI000415CCF6|nr:signal recognition particle-docking protein FtsY [Oceanobacter kriegii]